MLIEDKINFSEKRKVNFENFHHALEIVSEELTILLLWT